MNTTNYRFLLAAGLSLAMALTFSCSSDGGGGNNNSSSSDGRNVVYGPDVLYEGETYQTVVIGTDTWFARNLNYNPSTGNSWCYNNLESNCDKYGRLYDWATAMDLPSKCNTTTTLGTTDPDCIINTPRRGICPAGYHIADFEWSDLINVDVDTDVGFGSDTKNLKTTSGWDDYEGISNNGTDKYGFSALPSGHLYSGKFSGAGYEGSWWTIRMHNMYYDYAYHILISYDRPFQRNIRKTSDGASVRCVKD